AEFPLGAMACVGDIVCRRIRHSHAPAHACATSQHEPQEDDSEMQGPFRRIVTGHDEAGSAVIISDAPPARVVQVGGPGGPTFFEVWRTDVTPALIDRKPGEPAESGLVLAPPKKGTRIRVIDFPPEGDEIRRLSVAEAREHFGEMGGADA